MRCPKCHFENPDDSKFCKECGTQIISSEEIPASPTKTLETPPEELTRGTTFAGRYEIIEELGKGGMGKVYRVEDKKIKEEVALKLIKPEIASDKNTLERFSNELKITRKIAHRNVCKMYDLGEENGTHFITMEYIPGQDLKGLIRQTGQLTVGKSISIAKQVCDGLSEAHRLGVVHRDLKPGNIMVDREGNARIMDFGIARSLKTKRLTGAGVMIGTPEYMSPEQVEGKDTDQRSDIYSLGVILYEMLIGHVPFEGDTPFTVGVKHKSEIPKDPKELNAQIPEDLSQVILKCLEKDKDNRYRSAGDLRSELANIEKGIPTTEREAPGKKPFTSKEITVSFSLKKLFIPALVLAALIIAVVVTLLLLPKEQFVIGPKIKNSIAVISFKNQTGDKAYDYLQEAIPNLLITSLEQTGPHYVMTWERMYDLLKQIGKENVEVIDRDLGFKVCLMEGVESIVLGSFVKAGEMFATDVKILDVETKKHLKSAGSKGEGEGSIIKTQIDELSREISSGIGMTGQKGEKSELRIADVTTSSLEAYNYYLQGRKAEGKLYYEESRNFFEKAVELDSTFASAYISLGYVEGILGNRNARVEAYEKAKALADRTTEKERLRIEAHYAASIEGDMKKYLNIMKERAEKYPREKEGHRDLGYYYLMRDNLDLAIENYNKVIDLDPNNGMAHNQLGYIYMEMENFDKALEYFNKYVSISPDDANPYDSLADTYFQMGKLEEAITKYKKALKIKPDFWLTFLKLGYIYALKEDYKNAVKWIDLSYAAAQSPGRKMYAHLWRAFIRSWLGRYEDSLSELQEAARIADELKNSSRRILIEELRGQLCYQRDKLDLSQKYYKNWSEMGSTIYPKSGKFYKDCYKLFLGLIDVKRGKLDSAKSCLIELKSIRPSLELNIDNYMNYFYSLLYGELALAENQPEKVIAVLEKKSPESRTIFDSLGSVSMIRENMRLGEDILARAYQQNGEIDKAIDEYMQFITFDPEKKSRLLIHPRFHYKIARLYELKGWEGKAIEHYNKFLDLWKDTDPGIAEVEDAGKRVAGLKSH